MMRALVAFVAILATSPVVSGRPTATISSLDHTSKSTTKTTSKSHVTTKTPSTIGDVTSKPTTKISSIGPPTTTTSTTSTSSKSTTLPGGSRFKFPLPNGFPNPSKDQISTIETQAHGIFPNGPAPASLHAESETSLALIAFNELFEVAFFTELIDNITCSKPGYTLADVPDRDGVLTILQTVKAQEEMHALSAGSAFNKFTGKTVEPCQYAFPVNSFQTAIAVASTFTDVVLSTLPDIQGIFAANGDAELIPQLGSIIGQEGEQNGFYRHLLQKIPSALPFLTGGAREFAFNAILQNFIAPGNCSSADLLVSRGLRQYNVLKILTTNFTRGQDITAKFSMEPAKNLSTHTLRRNTDAASGPTEEKFLTYINQQNIPFSVPMNITDTDAKGGVKFTAPFPGKSHDLNGLTIAAVTSKSGPFQSPAEVAENTLFGPGLIEIA